MRADDPDEDPQPRHLPRRPPRHGIDPRDIPQPMAEILCASGRCSGLNLGMNTTLAYDQDFLAAKLDMADIAFDVLLETGILISPLPVWLDEWAHPEDDSNPDLLHNIARDGVPL
jgi:hypothetical protein